MSTRLSHTQPNKSMVSSGAPKTPSTIDDTKDLDARLDRLIRYTLPRSPYLLTVPTDKPYHVSPHQAGNWRKGTLFSEDEESLQYMSFLARDWGDSLLVTVGGWDDENGGIMKNNTFKADGANAGTSMPQQGQVPKKRITLSAYKDKKKAGGSGTVSPNVPTVNKVGTDNHKVNGVSSDAPKPVISQKPPENEKKRPLDAMDDSKSSKPSVSSEPSQPAKKPRTSPPPTDSVSKKPNSPSMNPHGLPPLLSPTLPASIEEELAKLPSSPRSLNGGPGHRKTMSLASSASDTKHLNLSRTSSPSLANNAKPHIKDQKTGVEPKAGSSSLHKLEPDPKLNGKAVEAGKRPPTAATKHGSRTPEVGNKSVKINGHAGASSFFEGLKTGNYTGAVVPPTSAPKVAKLEQPKKRKVLKLKIPKSLRKTVVRILQMKPQPRKTKEVESRSEKTVEDARKKNREEIGAKRHENDRERSRNERDRASDKAQKTTTKEEDKGHPRDSTKLAGKRPRPTEDENPREPPAKRQKPPTGLDFSQKPRTPIPPPFKSPALSQQGSAQKSQISTPKREVKSVAMRRMESGDGDVRTPQGAARGGTPTAPGSAEKVKSSSNVAPSSNTSNTGRNEEIAALRADHKKYLTLGRELKYAADKLLKSKEKDAFVDDESAKRGTAIAIECVLCYMLAFSLADTANHLTRQPSDASSWRSLLPYWNFVETKCQRYAHLHGLVLQLGAICRDIIHAHDLDRLSADPLPTAAAEEARPPTPGTEGDTGASSEVASKAAAYRKEYMDFKSKLVDNARVAQQLWIEGIHKLSVDGLKSGFPQTWARSAKGPVARVRERLVPGKYEGEFYLPLGCMTTGVEGVRAGWSLLGEWCAAEKVLWEGKMGL